MITPLEQITESDYLEFLRQRKLLSYTPADISSIDYLVKKYINNHHKSCSGCGSGSLRLAKDLCNVYLANGEERIKAVLYGDKSVKEEVIAKVDEPIQPKPDIEEIKPFKKKK